MLQRLASVLAPLVAALVLFTTADAHAQALNISDVSMVEGASGTQTFTFAVTLTAPAGPGGVTFDIATADGTAQDDNPAPEDNDYVAQSLTGQNIPMGSTGPYNFQVTVNGDNNPEATETFFVNVTNITGATPGDVQGLGTLIDDDTSLTIISAIQGTGASSPIVGNSVTIRGIVTGVTSNGFFVQEEEADYDADPNTSEGIFVFTSGTPPAAAAFTAQVQVTGTVSEFVPSGDPQQPPTTEITSPTVFQLLPAGQPLPAAAPLTALFPDPAGAFDQLERVEHMRVTAASITVTGPSGGTVTESSATGSSNGIFHGTLTGVARPFREAGIQQADTPSSGSIPPIPRWDFNPERLRIESAAINSQPVLTVKSGDVVGPVTGPLDYASRGYAIYPDGTGGAPVVTPGTLPTTVSVAGANEFTVSSFNLQRLFDTVNDPYADQVLTAAAYANRLAKASVAIRTHMRNPDIIGVQEVEKLSVLGDLAAKILADGGPTYDPYLVEGNDSTTGLDVGFLVKTTPVSGGQPRVSNVTVTQQGEATTWLDPRTGTPQLLNDRPPLVLEATVNRAAGATFPVVVVVNHLLDLTDIDSEVPAGLTTTGDYVRKKRLAQAQDLANDIQTRQTSNPNEHLVVTGDFNAFDVNDGYADVMNTIAGTPPPDNQTVVPGDGVDLVNPDLTTLVNTPPATQRYSQVDAGNASNADHTLVSTRLVTDTSARRVEHPRINADHPETERNNNATALRVSDRDPVVAYFTAGTLALTDLSITKDDSPDPVTAGQNLTYTIAVTNNGPDAAADVSLSDTLPAGTTFVSLSSPGGWSCTTPAEGAGGAIACSAAALANPGSAVFTLTVNVASSLAVGTVVSNMASVSSSTADADSGNNSATATTTVVTSADLSISKVDTPDPVTAGTNLTYTITVTNNGPSNAASASLSDTLPAGTSFESLSSPGGWSCTTPAQGTGGTISCSIASLGVGSAVFTLVVAVAPSTAAGTVLSNTATAASSTTDGNAGNNSATATTTVTASADVSISKVDTADPVTAGSNLTYTITVTNSGPSAAASASLSDTLPAGTTFVSLSSPGGWSCTTPAVGAGGAISCTNPSLGLGSAVFTLVVAVAPSTAAGTVLSNTATVSASTTDASPGNNSGTATTTVAASADLSITKIDTPDPVTAGSNLTYTITVTNNGPSAAASVSLSDTLPANTTFLSLSNPGWSCTAPAVGAGGTISCSNPSLAVGDAVFTLSVAVAPSIASGTVLSNTATVSASTADANAANNLATSTTTVATSADLSISSADAPDPVTAGTNLTYTITVTNNGPSHALSVSMSDTLPGTTTYVSLSSPAGWSCTTPAVGAGGTVSCSLPSLAPGSAVFTLTVAVAPSTPDGGVLFNTATVASSTPDANPADNSGPSATGVTTSADLSIAKVDTPDPVRAGSTISYTITAANNGPSHALSVTVTDAVPANTTFVSAALVTGSGWTPSVPAVGGTGNVVFSKGSVASSETAVFQVVVRVGAATAGGTIVTNTATIASTTTDPAPGNNSGSATTTVDGEPTITDIANQTIAEDTATAALPFTIGDVETAATSLTLSASSNDTTMIPNANIVFDGVGANRTVTVTPAANQNGEPVTITVNVSDGTLSASDTFTVTVTAVNDAPTIADVANQTIDEDTATTALAFTIGDLETAAAALTLAASSSNTTIVPPANIVFGGAGANRTVTVTPLANQHGGPVTITVTVSDGALSAADTFTLTVNAVNDAPTITAIGNLAIAANTSTPPLAFTVGDLETAAASLAVSAMSSNPALVAPTGFAFSAAGANRTITVTPNTDASGTAIITVTVNDGTVGVSTSFTLTVDAPGAPPSPPPSPPEPPEPPSPPPNQAPSIAGLVNRTFDENGTLTVTLTVGDDITPAANLSLTATSSNPAVVPASGLALSGTGTTRTLTITPAPDTAGPTTIAVTVADEGSMTATVTALIEVAIATVAPPPPTDFTAVATDSRVVLSWRQPAGSPHPSFFVIEGGTAPGSSTLPVVNTVTRRTTWTLSLPPGTYFFRARSGNRKGTSEVSNEAGVIVTSALNVPGAPVGLAVGVDGTRATFGWQRPVTGGEATAWIVELDTTPSPAARAGIDARGVGLALSDGTINGVEGPHDLRTFRLPAAILGGSIDLPRGEYVARVRGENSAGVGPPSNEPRFTVDLPSGGGCDAPDAPVLLPPAINSHTVTLTWRPPRTGGPASYRLLVGSLPGGSDLRIVNVGAVNAFVFDAPPGTYHATVVATNTCGPGAASNSVPVVVTGLVAPPPPTNVRVTVVGNTVTLAWDAAPGAVSYLIEAGTAPGASNAAVHPLVETSITAPGIPSGVYYVRVRAIGVGGASLPSAEVVIVVP